MEKLKELREQIEEIDTAIIAKLAEREKLVRQIGLLKVQNQITILDAHREQQLMHFYANLSAQHQLQPDFIQKLFMLILQHSKELQRNTH